MRRRMTLIGAMMMHRGEAHGMVCGTVGELGEHLHFIDQVIGKRNGASVYAAMNTLMLPGRQVTIVDTHVNQNPTAVQVAEIALMAAEELQRFGIKPKMALLSHSNFGSSRDPEAKKMRDALALIRDRAPDLIVDGEMHGDLALDAQMRERFMPGGTLEGEANLLVLQNLDAANIAYNLLKVVAGHGVAIGPVLLGANGPVHVMTPSATVRRIVNMTAWSVIDANHERYHG
jgi:malate dehydrogenase (oxaloacetate-decarboxylating)(NADP+)